MDVIGIICEYNPFHNGHVYHIKKIKELFPDSIIILVLNGYFTQRGIISVMSKEDKVNVALDNDIDIVLELPFVYGTQSSDIFAYQSIKILNEFKINYLVFGSESNNLKMLKKVVDKELNDKDFDSKVKSYLKEGINYPTALKKALNMEEDFNNPNDLLGISYLKAIEMINSSIIPITIKRTSSYHDLSSNERIVSATNIRERLKNGEDVSFFVPSEVLPCLHNVSNDCLFNLLKFKILTDKDLSIYLDVDEGIEYRILKYINEVSCIDELILKVKTKRYTYNKVNRMLLHILIGLSKEDNVKVSLDYIKILGFSEIGQSYLNKVKKYFNISTNVNKDSLLYKYEIKSAYLYEQATGLNLDNFDIKNIPLKKS